MRETIATDHANDKFDWGGPTLGAKWTPKVHRVTLVNESGQSSIGRYPTDWLNPRISDPLDSKLSLGTEYWG